MLAHDIHQGRHTVVKHGWPGTVVDTHPTWSGTTFTVQFTPTGKKYRGANVTLVGLTEADVQSA